MAQFEILSKVNLWATRNDKTTSYVKRCVKFCKFKVQNTRKLLLTHGAKAHTQIRHTIININFCNIFCIKNFTKVYKKGILIILPWYKHDLLLKTSGNIENIFSGPLDPYVANCVAKYIQLMRVKEVAETQLSGVPLDFRDRWILPLSVSW